MMVREIEISTQFGFEIKSLTPKKGVYLMETNKGRKCLKKINYNVSKLMYIHEAKEHIVNNGFNNIDRFNIAEKENVPYAVVNEDIYIVTDWIEGRECNFREEEDLKVASSTLAQFHLKARNFDPREEIKLRTDIGRYTTTIEKRSAMLGKMKNIARKKRKKSDFDITYLSNLEFYQELAKRAIKELNVDSYARVCEDSLKDKVLAHHDFAYHNIIIDEEKNPHIIDFDYCKSEMQIYDLATLCIKSLKRLDWNPKIFTNILEAYNSVREINKDEINVLKTLLIFPQRFWRVANRYYYKEASWGEGTFIRKINNIITERENYMNFIDNLNNLL